MNVSVVAVTRPLCLSAARGSRRVEDRLTDVLVAGAAAEIALERRPNVLFGGPRVLFRSLAAAVIMPGVP